MLHIPDNDVDEDPEQEVSTFLCMHPVVSLPRVTSSTPEAHGRGCLTYQVYSWAKVQWYQMVCLMIIVCEALRP